MNITVGGVTYTVGGTAKGSGMVHPNMATVFCFMTTDAPADSAWLAKTLRGAADVSLNMIDVDTDTSTSDTMLLFANGAAGGAAVGSGHQAESALRGAIEAVAQALAKDLARDGEGAKTLIEVRVEGAASLDDARRAARTVASSPLVKTMVTGRDANLGRVLMAVGRSGAAIEIDKTSVFIGEYPAFERGLPSSVSYETISKAMDRPEVVIRVDLGLGTATATAWGCDLTEEYVRINASYTT
jgi:glutamate N-acetyltransferase/amino-acid N-acetyltransferase